MDILTVISTIVTIAILGATLYKSYKSNAKGHNTTQGKIDSAINTIADNSNTVKNLEKAIGNLTNEVSALKGGK